MFNAIKAAFYFGAIITAFMDSFLFGILVMLICFALEYFIFDREHYR
tara:strand:- start:332 stop:472 length:141 start_codon:yes stop_codon:yes gene_type:complete